MLKSSNPALKPFEQPQKWGDYSGGADVAASKPTTMTIGGAIQAAGIQMGILTLFALITWTLFYEGILPSPAAYFVFLGGMVLGMILSFVLGGKPKLAPILGPAYCVVYGVMVGGLSYAISLALGAQLANNAALIGAGEAVANGVVVDREMLVNKGAFVVFQALLATIGVVVTLLVGYKAGLIRVRGVFRKVVLMAMGAMFFAVIAGLVLSMFGVGVPFFGTGPIGIAFTAIMAVLAALNVVMAFQIIEDGVNAGMPKYFEWYAGYAVVSAIAWLYVEILILLYKIYSSMNRE